MTDPISSYRRSSTLLAPRDSDSAEPTPPVSLDPRRPPPASKKVPIRSPIPEAPALLTPRHPSVEDGTRAAAARPLATRSPAPSEPLEKVRSDLEQLMDADSGVPFQHRAWSNLSSLEQAALELLEHTASSYGAAQEGELLAVPGLWSKPYGELSPDQQSAARSLGLGGRAWEENRRARTMLRADPELSTAVRALFKRPGVLSERDVEETVTPALSRTALPPPLQQEAIHTLLEFHGSRLSQGARLSLRDALFSSQEVGSGSGSVAYNGWDVLPQNGRVVNDAGGRSATPIRGVVPVSSPADARAAIDSARLSNAKLSIAGRRHSKGGQTTSPGGLQLDIQGMNRMALLPGDALRAESGATWAQSQALLSDHGLSLPVRQRSNFFTVGGSLGVNCHGPNAHGLPLSAFVSSLRLMTPRGEVVQCSRHENPELFRHALGGYGLYGMILDATLQAVPELPCSMEVESISFSELSDRMAQLQQDPSVEILYAEALPHGDGAALLHIGRTVDLDPDRVGRLDRAALRAVQAQATSGGPELLEARRWAASVAKGRTPISTRSDLLSPNIDGLRHRWNDPTRTTYLPQAYAVPSERGAEFFKDLSTLFREHGVSPDALSVQPLAADLDTALPYARESSLDFKLHLNPPLIAQDPHAERRFASDAIDAALDHGGSFYLPFQLHASPDQLRRGYPEIDQAFDFKRKVDPQGLFSNALYESFS